MEPQEPTPYQFTSPPFYVGFLPDLTGFNPIAPLFPTEALYPELFAYLKARDKSVRQIATDNPGGICVKHLKIKSVCGCARESKSPPETGGGPLLKIEDQP